MTYLFTYFFKIIKPKISTTGKQVPTSNPIFKLPPAKLEHIPTIDGPTEPPKPPPNAKNANIAVPPAGHFCAEMLNVPVENLRVISKEQYDAATEDENTEEYEDDEFN